MLQKRVLRESSGEAYSVLRTDTPYRSYSTYSVQYLQVAASSDWAVQERQSKIDSTSILYPYYKHKHKHNTHLPYSMEYSNARHRVSVPDPSILPART
jgi:hypothetical protein